MIKHLKPAVILFVIFSILTGVIYPAVVTGLAQILFAEQANGSLTTDDKGKLTGSRLIGQPFSHPKYFWGRPSATAPFAYNAGASSGSNLAVTNPALVDAVKARIEMLKTVDPKNDTPIPVDLITASGSGLDPHISPAAANYQLNRVAKVRNINPEQLRALVEKNTESRQLGFLGEPRVNVLKLNLALDSLHAVADVTVTNDRYTLPLSKAYMELGEKEALLLHQGTIEKQQTLHRHDEFLVQYEIKAPNDTEWLVLCDLATGKIIREQNLADDTK